MEEFSSVQIGAGIASESARTEAVVPRRDTNIEANNPVNDKAEIEVLSSDMALEISRSMERALNKSSTKVQFSVKTEEEGTNPITFRVINEKTGEVLREFPSEEVQKLAKNAREQAMQGLLVDSVI
jgi:uncharacterized FlaG/YvyC family protein